MNTEPEKQTNYRDLEKARYDAEQMAKQAAYFEAEFKDLERRQPTILAECIHKHLGPGITHSAARNSGLMTETYKAHLDKMKTAESQYLEAEKIYKTVIDFLKSVTAMEWRERERLKAGI